MSLLTTLLANAEALALLATAAAVATADGASILGASLFGSLCVAAIRPTYGDASDVYATIGVIVCAVGALSGGAVAALAPQKVTAVSAAGLVALPLALLLEKHGKCPDSGIAPDASGSVLGALLITILCGVALYLAERDPRRDAQVKRVAHALGAGWFAALALDVSLANGAALWVHAVAVARPGDVPGPDFVKYTFNELWACLVWAGVSALVYALRPATNRIGSLRAAAMPRSSDVRRDDGRASDAATHQLHLVAARTQHFNLFDPLKLPPALKRFSAKTFASAEALGNFFGLQDDNVRSQARTRRPCFGGARRRRGVDAIAAAVASMASSGGYAERDDARVASIARERTHGVTKKHAGRARPHALRQRVGTPSARPRVHRRGRRAGRKSSSCQTFRELPPVV